MLKHSKNQYLNYWDFFWISLTKGKMGACMLKKSPRTYVYSNSETDKHRFYTFF